MCWISLVIWLDKSHVIEVQRESWLAPGPSSPSSSSPFVHQLSPWASAPGPQPSPQVPSSSPLFGEEPMQVGLGLAHPCQTRPLVPGWCVHILWPIKPLHIHLSLAKRAPPLLSPCPTTTFQPPCATTSSPFPYMRWSTQAPKTVSCVCR